MLQLRDLPINDTKTVEVPFAVMSMIEKLINFKKKNNAKVKLVSLVPQPIVIKDKTNDLEFNKIYDICDAVHHDETTDKYTSFILYDLEPYGFLGEDKICQVRKFEINMKENQRGY